MTKYFLFLYLFLNVAFAKQVIGYIEHNYFFPIIEINNNKIETNISINDCLSFEALNSYKKPFKFKVQYYTNLFDRYTDKYNLVAKVNTSKSFDKILFSNEPKIITKDIVLFQNDIINFYQYFKNDKWGRNFYEKIKKPKTISDFEKTGIKIILITDINMDKNIELWITYRLMYGEIGRMIYEKKDNNWKMILWRCHSCD